MTNIIIPLSRINQKIIDDEVKEIIPDMVNQRFILNGAIVPCAILDDNQLLDSVYLRSCFE